MADEYGRPPHNRNVGVPEKYAWPALKSLKGAALEVHDVETLRELGTARGMLGQIFTKSQNKITDPAKLARLIEMVDGVEWVMLGSDTKGDIYDSILEKNAEDTKSGACQYFTPRALIVAMVECMAPEPGKTIADPLCGTGGFLLAAYDYLTREGSKLDKHQKAILKNGTFYGNEIVAGTRRLCLMNLLLRNIGEIDGESLISSADALVAQPSMAVDYVLANPPFVKMSSMTFTNEEGEQERDDLIYNRQDFWATTCNKQLNFLQHIRSHLKTTVRAAVVLPNKVLFEGGAGEIVRKKLLETTEFHSILRLPTDILYAHGVKANVLFIDSCPASKTTGTKNVWYYDYRTNIHHTLKRKPLRLEDLREFIGCDNPTHRHKRKETWNAESNPEGRWRKYSYQELAARDKTRFDLFW